MIQTVQKKTVEERLQIIEQYLLEIKSMLKPVASCKKTLVEDDVLMTVKDVAKLIKSDSTVVYAACKRNELAYIRLGKLYKFRKAEVLQWMNTQKDSPDNLLDGYIDNYLQKYQLKG